MRHTGIAIGRATAILVAGALFAAPVAHAGVPRSCVHPTTNRLECRAETRRVMHEVLPSARLQALREEARQLGRATTRSNDERNALLREILRRLERR